MFVPPLVLQFMLRDLKKKQPPQVADGEPTPVDDKNRTAINVGEDFPVAADAPDSDFYNQ